MGSLEAIILTINHFHADIFLLSKLGLSLISASFVFSGFTGKPSSVAELVFKPRCLKGPSYILASKSA